MSFSPVHLRPLLANDECFLWEMLWRASHADESGESIASIKANSELAVYAANWGRTGDLGWIAESPKPVGAVWVRKIRAYGFVDENVPELAIAVRHGHTRQGIGSQLVQAILSSCRSLFPGLSLSVRTDNPAALLYKRLGFIDVEGSHITNRVGKTSVTMLYRF